MSTGAFFASRVQEENWLPILELAVQEVFEIMLRQPVEPVKDSSTVAEVRGDYTAMVGLAGALCGILTVCCDKGAARQIAERMLGQEPESDTQIGDALGEIANMVAGNFKNKLAGTDERCMLSVPSVISGGEYSFHSLANGHVIEATLMFEGVPFVVRLQLQH